MRIIVLGTGALGSLFAARLARAGERHVTFAGTWREALDTVAARGLLVEETGRTWSVPVVTARRNDSLGPADVVLVLVKSAQTAAVARDASVALAADGLVVTLQNGLGNREVLAEAAGADRVALGVVTLGATLLGPGHVRALPGDVVLGAEPPTRAPLERLAALLSGAGFPATVDAPIDRVVWRKLAVNCAINPLTALLNVPNGGLLAQSETVETMCRAAREVGSVASALGIDLGLDPADLAQQVARTTATNRSSMLQDVERAVPTEIEALCGAVSREGERVGVPTPVNARLWREVRALEARGRAATAGTRC
jgi:2-dehydropantoate 2-reductase